MMSSALSSKLSRFQGTAFIVGAVGLVLAVILGFATGTTGFFQSYLYAFLFWMGLALGCLMLLFVQHLAGGSWGAMIRRPLEAGAMVIIPMAVLFIPVLFGMGNLYEWTNAEFVASSPLVQAKTAYLNVPFFLLRTVLYFATWIMGAWLFFRRSNDQDKDEENSGKIGFQLKRISGFWMVMFIMTMTFAGVDWAMSLTPEFFSGMYSVILMIGQVISAVSLMILIMVFLANNNEEIDALLTSKRLQDLGNFLMAFTLFWTYTSFSQLIIIWSNNIIETNPYYVLRFSAAWQGVGYFLLIFGFAAPFVILFSRWVKRKRRALVIVAIWALIIRLVDLFYIIIPNYERDGFPLQLIDIATVVGIGGIWLGVFFLILKRRPPLPLHDPRLAHAGEHHG